MNALASLPLPEFNTLSQQQVRGITCVFDGVALSPATAVDLGEHRIRRIHVSWFPRACRPCALPRAMQALQLHSGSCEQCVDDHTQCPTGLGLVRLVREARR
jgi:hypothetical protein